MTGLRALALDIDGTLISSSKQITRFTRSEIHRVVREYGTQVFLVTARGPQSAAVIEQSLGVQCSLATFGGALVWARSPDGSLLPLTEVPLPLDELTSILATAREFDVHAGLYSRNDWYVSSLDYWGLREARNTAVWPHVADLAETLSDAAAGPFFKVMFRGEQLPLAQLYAALGQLNHSTFAHHMKHVLEIVPASAVKLPAVEALAAHHGFTAAEVIAFGDAESDLAMLENVGVGVLMGNSTEALPAGVERTLSHDEDGIGVALRKHFPSNEPFLP